MAIEDAIFRRTELLKERLLSINPQAHITAIFGFMLAGWLSEIYYRPAVIVPYYLTGYEHAVVAACLVIAMHGVCRPDPDMDLLRSCYVLQPLCSCCSHRGSRGQVMQTDSTSRHDGI